MLFSIYPRIMVKLGGERYEYDRSTLKYTEMAAIERASGMSYAEWQTELNRSSIMAIGALLCVLRKRAGEPADYETLEFNVADLDWIPLHDDGTEFTPDEVTADIQRRVKEAAEPGPTAPAGSAASPRDPRAGDYRGYKPVFAEILGIRPWEWDLLTAEEFLDCKEYVDARVKKKRPVRPG